MWIIRFMVLLNPTPTSSTITLVMLLSVSADNCFFCLWFIQQIFGTYSGAGTVLELDQLPTTVLTIWTKRQTLYTHE